MEWVKQESCNKEKQDILLTMYQKAHAQRGWIKITKKISCSLYISILYSKIKFLRKGLCLFSEEWKQNTTTQPHLTETALRSEDAISLQITRGIWRTHFHLHSTMILSQRNNSLTVSSWVRLDPSSTRQDIFHYRNTLVLSSDITSQALYPTYFW